MTAFVRFNVVGILGFFLQAATLAALHARGMPLWLATCVAVEAAVLHNFVWHEHWTWAGLTTGTCAGRLARFHLSNGLISIAGNVALTSALVYSDVPLVIASACATLICALLNFGAAHAWVISHPTAHRTHGGDPGCAKTWPTFHGRLQ